ncbi:MAG: glyceraldehyde 3-phosphate dehydrogenase NAD-binding domain-containing protein [Bacteroidales bacterium]|nr:glyceraldehyde 3-phosphate dehydrogenase NAD-binding domain-containing protein [Bacteroidales bacterium]
MISINEKKLLGINGLGRIGKLSLWYHLISRKFDGVVINVGREVGKSLEDLVQTIITDSTYGSLQFFVNGRAGKPLNIEITDQEQQIITIDGFPIKVLSKERNPQNINWKDEGVRVVVDCTGKFLDPTIPATDPKGSILGHLNAGASKVICSAPFKMKNEPVGEPFPTLIYGINHTCFDPLHHNVISAASCTTTGLAHMMKPLLEDKETCNVLTASLSTVHAATNTQSVLDSVPSAGTKDLRKNRSVLNNIILSSTGAAKTLEKVIPQVIHFGFMADSIRIPTTTVSLIALNITFSSRMDENSMPYISGDYIRNIYKMAEKGNQNGLLFYSAKQNVSADLMGKPAAIVIEGNEIHTRTGFLKVPSEILAAAGIQNIQDINIPVTHAKIMGWYDNEFGSYVNCLGHLTEYVASHID